jgi:hypothetical protein
LSVGQINTALGAKGMTVTATRNLMADESAQISNVYCLAVFDPLEEKVYQGLGWIGALQQTLRGPEKDSDHYALQGVVLFPTAARASSFVHTSAQTWPVCADREYRVALSGQSSQAIWASSNVANADGTMTALLSQEGADGWACQRALTASNNVVIDILTCSFDTNPAATNIAHQIAVNAAHQR